MARNRTPEPHRGAGAATHAANKAPRAVGREAESHYRQVVEAAPIAFIAINPEGIIELVNTQTERLFGYRREELLGQPVEMLVPLRFRGNHPAHRTGFFATPQ